MKKLPIVAVLTVLLTMLGTSAFAHRAPQKTRGARAAYPVVELHRRERAATARLAAVACRRGLLASARNQPPLVRAFSLT